ncbi:MAG: putative toxin-antitoxin system toxin component, PIN family [Betaproteobacteria bacterium]|nr:putative toxin-antitoxin system toxin component, PIN family [Betaproteobacteria bacterium]
MPELPRIVLDTNVVLDLLHFGDPNVAAIDTAIRSGRVQAVTSAACLEELQRVLAYPEFGLDQTSRAALFVRYRQQCTLSDVPLAGPDAAITGLPRCPDPDDQKFLELAWHCGAACLVSKDKALLRLSRRMARIGGCAIVAPAVFDPDRLAPPA